jgi:hypothetical protein
MPNYVHLIGAEEVRKAGAEISSAAQQMASAAAHIDQALHMHRQFMVEWIERLEAVAEKLSNKEGQG